MIVSPTLRKSAAIGVAAVLGLAFAAPVIAQDDGYGYGYGYGNDGSDVTVRASPRGERDPATGAPLDYVSVTRTVSYRDLDLRTGYGVRTLRDRIERAAFDACNDIEMHYVPVNDDMRACIRAATREAMYQAPIDRTMYGLAN